MTRFRDCPCHGDANSRKLYLTCQVIIKYDSDSIALEKDGREREARLCQTEGVLFVEYQLDALVSTPLLNIWRTVSKVDRNARQFF